MKWIILALGILSNSAASVFVKVSMSPPWKFPSMENPWSLLNNWPLWLGLVLYGAAFFLYAAALTKLPLNVAQPILTAGAIALVSLASVCIFRETFTWAGGLGLVLIVVGVFLISSQPTTRSP